MAVATCSHNSSAMIGYGDALQRILDASPGPISESCGSADALGRILLEPCVAADALPAFDNAAMDGFALALDSQGAAADELFEVAGRQAAGDPACHADSAMEIMTGARLPQELNSVVPVERVVVEARSESGEVQRIRLLDAVAAGAHVRRRGEDVANAETVITAGQQIHVEQRALLAALGIGCLSVARRPRIGLLCTGRELVDEPSRTLASGQIRNSNGPWLQGRIEQAGAECVYSSTVSDEASAFLAELQCCLQRGASVVVSTGAVSMGRHDFIPDALRSIGADIVFHKCRIRPGKPILFARLPGGQLYFGLPGNPVSSAVGFRFFVEPALRHMLGLAAEIPLQLPLRHALGERPPLRGFAKARLRLDADARLSAELLPGQESFRIRPLLDCTAWMVLPEHGQPLPAGSAVAVFSLSHLQALSLPGVQA